MADDTQAFFNAPSSEKVALELMQLIARAEGKHFERHSDNPANRNWILSTYAQCRAVVVMGLKAPDVLRERPLME